MNRASIIALTVTLLIVISAGFITKRSYDNKIKRLEEMNTEMLLRFNQELNFINNNKLKEINDKMERIEVKIQQVSDIKRERIKEVEAIRTYSSREVDEFFESRGIR